MNIRDGRPRTVAFTNDLNGQAIRRDEQDRTMTSASGDPHEVWHRFGGKELGFIGNNGSFNTTFHASIADRATVLGNGAFKNGSTGAVAAADFDQSLSQINSYNQGSSSGSYTVRSGETLSSIAANLWGDASLWYKLAEANGLSGQSALIVGQSLHIPAGVMKSTHNAGTFKPYDPADVIGDTGPTSPIQPKPKKNKCGAFGQFLLAVVAVAVVALTQGAATSFFSGILGEGVASTVAGGAAAGAAGSAVSQAVGVATGIQDKFSWNAVGLAALESGIGAGLKLEGVGGKGPVGGAIRGALGSAGAQGIAAAIGPQDKFSWSSVAAAAVISGIGEGYNPGGPLAPALKLSAKVIGGAATLSLIDGTDFDDNIRAILPSIIGSTVGDRNRITGAGREAFIRGELARKYPGANIQNEVYLLTHNGDRAIDPLTGEGRRIDSVVIKDGRVLDSVEITGPTTNKASQILKEQRIRALGGTFVLDDQTQGLIDISNIRTRLVSIP